MNNKNKIGLFSCITIIAGGMFGSAIFSLSGLTIYNAGASAILSWIIAAVIMLIYGLVCAELSTIFPRSGGVFVFPSKALGKKRSTGALWGWISTWGYINANIVAVAFAAVYVGTYLSAGFGLDSSLQIPLALISILICLFLNLIRFSSTGKLNNILVGSLVLTLLIYIFTTFFSGKWNPTNLTPFFSGTGGMTGFLSSVPTAMIGYGSIVAIAFMVSEVKEPNKNVPRAVLIAMILVALIYTLIITATIGLLPTQFFQENPSMRYIPLYAACYTQLPQFTWLPKVVSISAVLALLTTMLVVLALTARAIQAAAHSKILPKQFSSTDKNGTPVFSTCVVAFLSAIISCFPDFTSTIVGFGALFASVTITINIISLYFARKKHPHIEGHFRAPGGNILPAIALILIIICYIPDILSGGWMIWIYTIIWYLIGFLIFHFSKFSQQKR